MRHILAIVLLFICHAGFAQVQFFEGSLEEALHKASASGKMVFVHFVSATCEQCNDVADKAFEDVALGKVGSKCKCCTTKP